MGKRQPVPCLSCGTPLWSVGDPCTNEACPRALHLGARRNGFSPMEGPSLYRQQREMEADRSILKRHALQALTGQGGHSNRQIGAIVLESDVRYPC